ncbi:hypothetical protein [Cellulomonas taurus]|uniref:hypothetical protein n=1 Tax=Cellulomonas taurus TaxID=2729175 RepID=UPI00145E4E95|nr:hypothetical protein [Cellulomonas taurus]
MGLRKTAGIALATVALFGATTLAAPAAQALLPIKWGPYPTYAACKDRMERAKPYVTRVSACSGEKQGNGTVLWYFRSTQ